MKNNFFKHSLALLLALFCAMGALPQSASAAAGAPASITQISSNYVTLNGQFVRYRAASDVINNVGLPFVFYERVDVPGCGPVRALCAHQLGALDNAANGQKWDFESEVTHPSLAALLTYVYSFTNGTFTDEGRAVGLGTWNEPWSDLWFMAAQAMSWYYEHGILIDCTVDRVGFLTQLAQEFVAAFKLYHSAYGWAPWITDWNSVDIHTILTSEDNGATGKTALGLAQEAMDLVRDHPQYFPQYRLWIYDWDESQPWKLVGQEGTPMQKLLVAVPEQSPVQGAEVSLTVKKLEAGTNQPLAGATFKVERAAGSGGFSVTRTTGADGTITLTQKEDGLVAGQYRITEVAAPAGYAALGSSQLVTVLPGEAAGSVFTFYNEPGKEGSGSIRKVDTDNPSLGLAGAVIKLTSVKLDDGGSFAGTCTTGEGGNISKEDLDFSKLPTGSYVAEEITPPEGYILSSDVSKVKQTFVWDGKHNVSLLFENSAKVKVQLKKVDEAGNPLAGAVFVILRDGQVIGTGETDGSGTITVPNISEGYFEFREVSAPAGYDCDRAPVGVHINAEDLQGEQTITVEKVNHKLRTLTIQKRDAQTGEAIPGTAFHIRGMNLAYENDAVTGADGKAVLSEMPSGCYEITETSVPSPYILDTENRKIVWIDANQGKDIVVDFVNSKKPSLTVNKVDSVTGSPIQGAKFEVWYASNNTTTGELNSLGTFFSDENGQFNIDLLRDGWYKVTELEPAPGFTIKGPATQEFYLQAGTSKSVTFENVPKNAIIVEKYDSVTGQVLPGCTFQLKYLGGASGMGGTVIGTKVTGKNGTAIWAGLNPGTYVIEEIDAADGYSILQASETVLLADSGEQSVVTVRFQNAPDGNLLIRKVSATNPSIPLQNAEFKVMYADGTLIGDSNGIFRTDENGQVRITGLKPGKSVVVTEVKAPNGFIIDTQAQTIQIKEGRTVTLTFKNQPMGNLIVRKLDSLTGKPLAGVQFKITYADGRVVDAEGGKLSSGGLYTTDKNGQVRISGITGTLIVTEVQALPGYTIDEATRTQTVVVNPDDTQSLSFYNTPIGGVELIKVDAADKSKRLSGAVFEIRQVGGTLVDTVTTGKTGRVYVDLDAGSYYAVEIEAPKGYELDKTPHYFTVKNGETTGVTITNKALSGILIHKTDSTTGEAIQGVTFLLYDSGFTPIGQFVSDNSGFVYIDDLSELGRYYLRELDNPGYVPDIRLKTVYVKAGETTLIEWQNTPIRGQIQIIKKSADYNSCNGLPAGSPLEGAVFEIRDKAGNLVDTIRSGKNGVAVSRPLPLGRYTIKETKAPDNYCAGGEELTACLDDAGQIVRFEVANKSVSLGVAIQKASYVEVMPGQNIRYTFSGISNTSNVPLQSFFWRDTLPVNAVRLAKITTGTYSAPGSYKILYQTNLSGGEYRTMYDNLSTARSYVLEASPAVLGLASGEYVTEFLFEFGVVPAGFHQIEAPKVDCTVLPSVQGGSRFTNNADTGGIYGGRWIQAAARWVTQVYAPAKPLPTTGY